MLKLVKGELFKFVKSSTFYVVTGLAMLVIIVTAAVYNPDSEGWNSVTSFLGGTVVADDYFTYIDGADYSEYTARYEIDVTFSDYQKTNAAFTKETKLTYMTTPLADYYVALNPISKISNSSQAFKTLDVPAADGFLTWNDDPTSDGDILSDKGELTKYILSDFNFYKLFLRQGDSFVERKDWLSNLFKNNNVAQIEENLKNTEKAALYDTGSKLSYSVNNAAVTEALESENGAAIRTAMVTLLKDAFNNASAAAAYEDFMFYNVYMRPVHSHVYSSAQGALKSAARTLDIYKKFFYYRESRDGASFTDFIKQSVIDYGQAFIALQNAANAVENHEQNTEATRSQVKALLDAYRRFTSLYDFSRSMMNTGYGVGVNFLFFYTGSSGSSIMSMISAAPEEYGEYNSRHSSINGYISTTNSNVGENLSYSNVFEAIKGFIVTMELESLIFQDQGDNGLSPIESRMRDTLALVDLSLSVDIDQKSYDGNFAFIDQRIELLMTRLAKMSKNNVIRLFLDKYYSGDLYDGLSAAFASGRPSYDEFINAGRTIVIESGYVADYVRKENLSLIIADQNFVDADLNNIYGIFNYLVIGTSKYSLRSDVAQIVFMLDNREMLGELTTPLSLDRGYGYMIFGFNILYYFLIMIGIVIGAGTIAGEHSAGTIKLLLIRPYKRWKFLLSKIYMTIIVMLILFAVSFGLMFLIGGIFWGFGSSFNVLIMFNAAKVLIMKPAGVMALMFLFYFLECMVYTMISIMVSTVFRSKAGAVAVSMAIYFAANIMILMLASNDWFKYVLFNNTNLFYYLSTGPTLNDMTFGFSLIVDLVYLSVITASMFWVFTKKDAN
jgi:ABC-type transport system involved in multi-copper enzyme maturation permease subunit